MTERQRERIRLCVNQLSIAMQVSADCGSVLPHPLQALSSQLRKCRIKGVSKLLERVIVERLETVELIFKLQCNDDEVAEREAEHLLVGIELLVSANNLLGMFSPRFFCGDQKVFAQPSTRLKTLNNHSVQSRCKRTYYRTAKCRKCCY